MNIPTLPTLPPLELVLPPLPQIVAPVQMELEVTGWYPIVTKPVRSGWYDLLTIDKDVERRWFDVTTGHWRCVSGKEPTTIYAFWRGQVCAAV